MSDVQRDKERKSEAMRARTHSFQVNVKELQRESVIIIASLEPLLTAWEITEILYFGVLTARSSRITSFYGSAN